MIFEGYTGPKETRGDFMAASSRQVRHPRNGSGRDRPRPVRIGFTHAGDVRQPSPAYEKTPVHPAPAIEPEVLQELIESGIPEARVSVTDLTGTRDHYRVEVVSPAFAGRTRVQQHQMVYRAVGEHMTEAVHALQIRTATPGD